MKQQELERAVARQTGESVNCIRQMGFQLIEVKTPRPNPRRRQTGYPSATMLMRLASKLGLQAA